MTETKLLLLSAVERKLLTAEGQLLQQRVHAAQQVVNKAQAAFNSAIDEIIKTKPMRDRPPESAKASYDEAQGALVWEAPVADPEPQPEPAGA